ncbi:hypothetical protein HMPREF0766_13438 [Sphingobacterium spiritivorum ATCC 33861]|uniref:Uncharacterized protein n=1 Tax=Sphingobacterium spiritivorum ATCC 33861 TaxID=525373 RepID=D7VR34_SPHSI|nr:hypothetical protein HMPREF0766_13438 [Sphingobacterium spiritivorum ATCC 33861]
MVTGFNLSTAGKCYKSSVKIQKNANAYNSNIFSMCYLFW